MTDKGKIALRLVTIVLVWGLSANNFEGMWGFFGQPLEDMTGGGEQVSDLCSWRILSEVKSCNVSYLNSGMCAPSKRMFTSSKQAGH